MPNRQREHRLLYKLIASRSDPSPKARSSSRSGGVLPKRSAEKTLTSQTPRHRSAPVFLARRSRAGGSRRTQADEAGESEARRGGGGGGYTPNEHTSRRVTNEATHTKAAPRARSAPPFNTRHTQESKLPNKTDNGTRRTDLTTRWKRTIRLRCVPVGGSVNVSSVCA